ncbi:1-deoxy-D-xylulose-5-phosphate synthase [Halosquirtibacter laminarini]|uniref:1-deoxy-D-xylulose-5-phosphate synthase n=1 Tax=Halosquirtibacter laminarini TaxID=3374600 RepID=A0AC61NE48_9BACT|nr:1-deoxy-D-xylulose-5-phosphate synthase [Prolixibacteraceae bacterium]
MEKNLLYSIQSPSDLRELKVEELRQVCAELRDFILKSNAENPGHLGANLGVVELTVALHYVYNTPFDRLIWDVGHQAYGHKILTGRRDEFHTNRKFKGLCGFPSREESIYDAFGVGHSSTSISAGLGMSVGTSLSGEDRKVVAVIGDGSMTGGMAFEGLNNAAITKSDILVVLNDNQMAIDPNVGGVSQYLVNMSTSTAYNKLRNDVWNLLGSMNSFGPKARKIVHQTQMGLKSMLLRSSNLFEGLNFRYFGPIDGHDTENMVRIMEDLKRIKGPKLLHVITKKGKGFKPAEDDQTKWHAAPGRFDTETGLVIKTTTNKEEKSPIKYQDVFGETIVELSMKNENIVGITPAMPTGCSMNKMMREFPERSFDVGIAEQHAVTFSAGLACEGKMPFCNIYSSFMQRAYDQVIHDVALQKLDVTFFLDRGGLVGADGATHHGVFDLAFLRIIPNMTIAAPMDEWELRDMMYTYQDFGYGPVSIRYPRGKGVRVDWKNEMHKVAPGVGRMLRQGEKIAVLSLGHPGNFVSEALDQIEISSGYQFTHYDMRYVKPLDVNIIQQIASGNYDYVVTVEDGVIQGGFGSAVLEELSLFSYKGGVIRLGVPDHFVEHGTQDDLYRVCEFDVDGIKNKLEELISKL